MERTEGVIDEYWRAEEGKMALLLRSIKGLFAGKGRSKSG